MSSKEEEMHSVDVVCGNRLSFHHVHLYVDRLDDVSVYKTLEKRLNAFAATMAKKKLNGHRRSKDNLDKARTLWRSLGERNEKNRGAAGRDVVRQLLAGPGFRVTGAYQGVATTSVLVTSKDKSGTRFVVTAPSSDGGLDALIVDRSSEETRSPERYRHFSVDELRRVVVSQTSRDRTSGTTFRPRQSIAVLAFQVDDMDTLRTVRDRYVKHHPSLLACDIRAYEKERVAVLEVFAYYQNDVKTSGADKGTLIRFLCDTHETKRSMILLPGLDPCSAKFDVTLDALPIYSDHWVSNVVSRTGFLSTLNDTLGFSPKVNFNAGVVAAGEAQIESTVTGNESSLKTTDKNVALTDQSQIYLPTNNALSVKGHVYQFLREIGQGVQHVANRCDDVVTLISRINYYEAVTNEAFTFLNIPRSYYGRLVSADVTSACPSLDDDSVASLMVSLCDRDVVSAHGICRLDVCDADVRDAIDKISDAKHRANAQRVADAIIKVVKMSRYVNLHKLLRDRLSESTYLEIVRNKILVDIQGRDVLYQIFTGNVLQRHPNEEAPFFEFIQRVCDANGETVPAGCGGFGIRNFLTLFLSIEVSKAMSGYQRAIEMGDTVAASFEQRRIDLFTHQMDVSNPVLTEISDAMTAENDALRDAEIATSDEEKRELRAKAEAFRKTKEDGNKKLMSISSSCRDKMRAIREEQQRAASSSVTAARA